MTRGVSRRSQNAAAIFHNFHGGKLDAAPNCAHNRTGRLLALLAIGARLRSLASFPATGAGQPAEIRLGPARDLVLGIT